MNRAERRKYLKSTEYFRKKKKLSMQQWGDVVNQNNVKGKELHLNFIDTLKGQLSEDLIKKEENLRELWKETMTAEEIESKINTWYQTVIKDDSLLMQK